MSTTPDPKRLPIESPTHLPPTPPQRLSPSSSHKHLSHLKTSFRKPFKRNTTQFTLFAQLPTELREQIWEVSITSRVHELHPCSSLYRNRMTFRSNSSSTPSIFHTCRESRSVALKHYKLMDYTPTSTSQNTEGDPSTLGKGILRFYYAPKHDTLFLNSLMGLFMVFMLLEEPIHTETPRQIEGILAGWEKVALDAERAQLTILLAGAMGHLPRPKFKKLMPDLKELIVAFDYTKSGKTRFRTSVWPGENGTKLKELKNKKGVKGLLDGCLQPLSGFLKDEYTTVDGKWVLDDRDAEEAVDGYGVPVLSVLDIERKKYLRGDLRYAFRICCGILGVRPRGVLRRL